MKPLYEVIEKLVDESDAVFTIAKELGFGDIRIQMKTDDSLHLLVAKLPSAATSLKGLTPELYLRVVLENLLDAQVRINIKDNIREEFIDDYMNESTPLVSGEKEEILNFFKHIAHISIKGAKDPVSEDEDVFGDQSQRRNYLDKALNYLPTKFFTKKEEAKKVEPKKEEAKKEEAKKESTPRQSR